MYLFYKEDTVVACLISHESLLQLWTPYSKCSITQYLKACPKHGEQQLVHSDLRVQAGV